MLRFVYIPVPMLRNRIDRHVLSRALLPKAVRRGNLDLVFTISALLDHQHPRMDEGLRTRAVAATFEDCWPLCGVLDFNRRAYSKVAALVRVAGSNQTRDAAGLGALALALARGDRSVLRDDRGDTAIKTLSTAIARPEDYWNWIQAQPHTAEGAAIVEKALRFKAVGRSAGRATVKAAAYLAVTGKLPHIESRPADKEAFPYWIAFDHHTPQGRQALKDVSRDLHIPYAQLAWSFFYFEGSTASGQMEAAWWQRYCRWQFKRVGLAPVEAPLLWEPARRQVADALAFDANRLHRILYAWKISHQEQVDTLRSQVALLLSNFKRLKGDQMPLFD